MLLRALVPMTVTTCDICFGRKKRGKREEELGLLYPRVEWHFPVCAPWDPNPLKYLGWGKVGFREVETLQKPTPKKKKSTTTVQWSNPSEKDFIFLPTHREAENIIRTFKVLARS